MIKGVLIDDDFNGGVTDRTAKVVIGLDVYFNFFTQPERFLPAFSSGVFTATLNSGSLYSSKSE